MGPWLPEGCRHRHPGGGVRSNIIVTEEAPHVAVAPYAETKQVDLIALSARGRSGPSRWLMGSVAACIMHGPRVPVLLYGDSRDTHQLHGSVV